MLLYLKEELKYRIENFSDVVNVNLGVNENLSYFLAEISFERGNIVNKVRYLQSLLLKMHLLYCYKECCRIYDKVNGIVLGRT